jgi:tetratricopeptide (TPR) repeat protein
MTMRTEAEWEADLTDLEAKVKDRKPADELASPLRTLADEIPDGSKLRPRALRLRGIVLNRLKEPKKALAVLRQARQAAIEQADLAEIIETGREIAVVHSWRGEDRHAALALLRAVAVACLHNDHVATALALSEAGRIELEARRFDEAERLFRLIADEAPQKLDDYQLHRAKINLCQALNRLDRHEEALQLADGLLAKPPTGHDRLIFLTLLERSRAHAGLKALDQAVSSLDCARKLLPTDPHKFEHDELREAEAELKLARQDFSAIEDLKTLAKKYTGPDLTVRAANLRIMAANVLFKTGKAEEAGRLLADALAAAVKAGLPDLAASIRKEMLEGDGAKQLDTVLNNLGAIKSIGGEWSTDWQIIRMETLGKGGGGKVYRAIDLRDGQEVAVKEVSIATPSREKLDQIIETVRNEYAIAVALPEKRGIANVRSLLCDPDGTLYIVQDFIKGTSLTKLYQPEPLPGKLLPLLLQVTGALATLHASRIVHRDLKPDNVMVRKRDGCDEAVVIDFGIALLDGEKDTLKYYGTAGYMAPEQALGEAVDGRADIYSLGRMIAEIWIGEGRSGTIPQPLAGVVREMLQDKPEQRPTLDAVKSALDACCKTLKT